MLACRFVRGVAQRHSRGSRSSSGGSNLFYDSQSGQFMAKPGSAGLRFHVHHPPPAADPPLPHTSYILPLPVAAHPPHCVYYSVSSPAQLEALAAAGAGAALAAAPESVPALLPLLSRACALHLPTHVTLLRCFRVAAGGHPDVNAAARAVEDAVGALADAGAGVVALRDCGGSATEESLREVVEAAFNLDVAGEAVMERLSVGVGSAALLRAALALGVTRAEVGAGAGLLPLAEAAAAAAAARAGKQHS
jgi:hypothetical protein